MMEYISKQFAVEELENLRQQYEMHDDCDELVARKCKNAVSALPAADVAPVVHGHWFFTEYEFFTCSVCGGTYYNGAESTAQAESYLNSGFVYKYCPNCGAKMDL